MSSPRPLWFLALVPVVASGCRHRPTDCAYDSVERCLWEGGVAKPDEQSGTGNVDNGVDVEGEGLGPLDQTLDDIVELMGVGLEWSLVDERTRAMCADEPRAAGVETKDGEQPEAPAVGEPWSCRPQQELEINGIPLLLEAGSGVVALSTISATDEQSAEMVEFALTRFDDWCDRDYFDPLEGQIYQELYRCSLPEGPFLLVGRFARDLDADVWQVSIAVMDEG